MLAAEGLARRQRSVCVFPHGPPGSKRSLWELAVRSVKGWLLHPLRCLIPAYARYLCNCRGTVGARCRKYVGMVFSSFALLHSAYIEHPMKGWCSWELGMRSIWGLAFQPPHCLNPAHTEHFCRWQRMGVVEC